MLSSGWGDQTHMQCSSWECPKASRTMHSTLYLVLTRVVTLVAFAAANREDLSISTNSSLKSLSPHCNCQLWSQFHAISLITPSHPDLQPHIQLQWSFLDVLLEIISISMITWKPHSTTQKPGNYCVRFLHHNTTEMLSKTGLSTELLGEE